MKSATSRPLTFAQSLRFALGVVAVYYPLTVYANFPVGEFSLLSADLPFLVGLGLVHWLCFLGWIMLSDRVLARTDYDLRGGPGVQYRVLVQGLAVASAVVAGLALSGIVAFLLAATHRTNALGPEPPAPAAPAAYRHEGTFAINPSERYRRANEGLSIVIMLAIFYTVSNRRVYQRLRDNQVQTERLEKESVLAQFAALKNQVSPHFLFNSLSILSSLVHVDAELSEQFIDRLARSYRYILEQKDNDRVALSTELQFIESYTFLLKIRFESGFDVRVQVPGAEAKRFHIAPLTLQLLIENAVKHNRMSPEEPLTVVIELDGHDCLVVRNHLQPREQLDASTGTGLQNIINRYQLLTPRPVWLGEQAGEFVVKIPLLS